MRTQTQRNRAHAVAIEEMEDAAPEIPFAEGTRDELDPDLRHRLVSELAYARFCARGYVDGYDLEDWLQAQAEVDHMALHPREAA